MYAPDKPFKVYCTKCWWGDGWEGLSTAEHMIRASIFEQLKDLMQEVPLVNRFVYEDTMVNSDYTNMANSLKNCYLVFNSMGKPTACENCIYGEALISVTDCVDNAYLLQSQICNRSVNLQHSLSGILFKGLQILPRFIFFKQLRQL